MLPHRDRGCSAASRQRTYELRATTSLARLLARQGRRDEARTTLAEIYNWFTEGFDTVDQKEAKALLEELTAQHAQAGYAARTAKQKTPRG